MPETPKGSPKREREPNKELESARYEMHAARARSFEREKADQRCEDNGFTDPDHGSAGAFDGVGGTSSGEIASGMASLFCEKELAKLHDTEPQTVEKYLRDTLQGAHEKIWTQAQRIHSDMMTTGVIAKVFRHNGIDYAAYAWVGDSRAHRISDGQPDILTLDDALWLHYVPKDKQRLEQYHQALAKTERELMELGQQGLVLLENFVEDNRVTQTLGKRQIDNRKGSYTQPPALGTIEVHSGVVALEPGDRLLLTTDGVHGPIPLETLSEIANGDPASAPQKLIDEAHRIAKAGLPRGRNDDCLAILISPKKA
jgi:PPM family protein phosphatase